MCIAAGSRRLSRIGACREWPSVPTKRPPADDQPYVPHPADERIVLPGIEGRPEVPRDVAKMLTEGVMEPKKIAFLLNLSMLGNRTRAARATGVSPVTTWLWRRDDDVFRKRYEEAMKIAAELHEDEMYRRASEGTLEPVFQGGRLVGSVRKFSDTLLIFTLKGAMPDKYKERVEHSGTVDLAQRLKAGRERALGRGEKK